MSASTPGRRAVSAADHGFRTEAFSAEDLAAIRRTDAEGRAARGQSQTAPAQQEREDRVQQERGDSRGAGAGLSADEQQTRPLDRVSARRDPFARTTPATTPSQTDAGLDAGRLPRGGPRVAQVLLAVLAPLVLLVGLVRMVASPVFLWLEYHRPGFPADPYGFSTSDRMHYGSAGLDYLFNLAPPRYLADLRWQGVPVLSEAEISHMDDVKAVMLVTTSIGAVLGLLCLALLAYLARTSPGGVRRALFAGAVWLLVALLVLAVVGLLGWEALFAGFHALFFAEGTWTFAASDGLIRLYPGRFWIDAALVLAGSGLLAALLTLICCAPTRRRRERDRRRRDHLMQLRAERVLARAR